MGFIPFFKRPDPKFTYLDRIEASIQIGGTEIYVCKRGIGWECGEEEEDETDLTEEEEYRSPPTTNNQNPTRLD